MEKSSLKEQGERAEAALSGKCEVIFGCCYYFAKMTGEGALEP